MTLPARPEANAPCPDDGQNERRQEDTSNSVMLDRKLLYTALTRARKQVVLIGQPRAVHISVSEARASARSTHLCHRLTRALLSGGGSALPSDSNPTGAETNSP